MTTQAVEDCRTTVPVWKDNTSSIPTSSKFRRQGTKLVSALKALSLTSSGRLLFSCRPHGKHGDLGPNCSWFRIRQVRQIGNGAWEARSYPSTKPKIQTCP